MKQNTTNKKRKYQTPISFRPRDTWTHDFVYLHSQNSAITPLTSVLQNLKDATLGHKKFVFDQKSVDSLHLRHTLEVNFSKLKKHSGAFELLGAERGGQN